MKTARDHTILECLGYWSGPGGGDAAHMIGLAFDAGVRAEAERRDKIDTAPTHVCIVCKKPSGVHPSLCYEHDPDFGAKEVASG